MTVCSARSFASALVAAILLAGCGGGGGGGSGGSASAGGSSTPPASSGPTWTANSFQSASTFKNFCATVRTGADAEGNAFPDKAGSLLQEMFWLRSWTHETYLWNTEVTDQNPSNFSDRITYFNTLKTTALTSSGKPKDQFHFNMSTADYLAQSLSTPSASYGAEIRVFAASPPRDVRVVFTTANTPATELLAGTPKLSRGARILTADGIDVVNGGTTQAQIDTLNSAIFPTNAGETHTLLVQYPDGSQRTVSLTSADLVESPVNRTAVLPSATGNVGYILLNTFSPFSSEKAIIDAIAAMKAQSVTDVVLDLRYNGGGLLAVASELGYLIAGPTQTSGKIFERLQFNAAAGSTNPVTGGANNATPFYTTALGFSVADGTALQPLSLPRVFILTTGSTCSASEAVINGLRGIDVQVVLIGGTTCGKPYGFYPADNCGETYFSIQFKGVNQKSFGDYADGFAASNSSATYPIKLPGCSVGDDYGHELGDPAEGMLAAALAYRSTGSCPAAVASTLGVASRPPGVNAMATSGRSEAVQILRSNRDMRLPARPRAAQ
jgi:C-terminal processing protease CtpA/Prc